MLIFRVFYKLFNVSLGFWLFFCQFVSIFFTFWYFFDIFYKFLIIFLANFAASSGTRVKSDELETRIDLLPNSGRPGNENAYRIQPKPSLFFFC